MDDGRDGAEGDAELDDVRDHMMMIPSFFSIPLSLWKSKKEKKSRSCLFGAFLVPIEEVQGPGSWGDELRRRLIVRGWLVG